MWKMETPTTGRTDGNQYDDRNTERNEMKKKKTFVFTFGKLGPLKVC